MAEYLLINSDNEPFFVKSPLYHEKYLESSALLAVILFFDLSAKNTFPASSNWAFN
ncbi:MAG: hypothetical protein ABR502_07825 [Chitinophagaceae bacterium]